MVPAEVDLTDFGYMPLDIRRLLTSETWIEAADDPKIGHASLCLWCEAWHQVPAASLPDNDKVLARLAMCDAKTWARIKTKVLAGWVKCSDGLLYHPVVAEKARESWKVKCAQRARTRAATEAREAKRKERDEQRNVQRDEIRETQRDEQRDVERDVHQEKGREGKENLNPPVKAQLSGIRDIPADPNRVAALRSVLQADGRVTLDAKTGMHLRQWAAEGVTDQQLADAVAIARDRKPHPEIIPPGYLATIVPEVRSGSAPQRRQSLEEAKADGLRRIEETERREREREAERRALNEMRGRANAA